MQEMIKSKGYFILFRMAIVREVKIQSQKAKKITTRKLHFYFDFLLVLKDLPA